MNEILLSAISVAGGVAIAWVTALAKRPSRIRDLVDTSGQLADRWLNEVKRLDIELEEERLTSRQLRLRISRLESHMRRNGLDPMTVNGETS